MEYQTLTTADGAAQADVTDALIRFANGMDTDNGALISSAFALNAYVDFTPAAQKVGMQFPVLEGRDAVVAALVPFAEVYTTTHSVSNARAIIEGDTARLYALVEAQHFPNGVSDRNFLMKNRYELELVREQIADGSAGATWLISKMTIDNLWSSGDVRIMTGE
jgi:SnoaL-like domain